MDRLQPLGRIRGICHITEDCLYPSFTFKLCLERGVGPQWLSANYYLLLRLSKPSNPKLKWDIQAFHWLHIINPPSVKTICLQKIKYKIYILNLSCLIHLHCFLFPPTGGGSRLLTFSGHKKYLKEIKTLMCISRKSWNVPKNGNVFLLSVFCGALFGLGRDGWGGPGSWKEQRCSQQLYPTAVLLQKWHPRHCWHLGRGEKRQDLLCSGS